jgi:hypothetical protein
MFCASDKNCGLSLKSLFFESNSFELEYFFKEIFLKNNFDFRKKSEKLKKIFE